jgi:hypothetical protein
MYILHYLFIFMHICQDRANYFEFYYLTLVGLPAFVGRFMYEKEKEKNLFCRTFA